MIDRLVITGDEIGVEEFRGKRFLEFDSDDLFGPASLNQRGKLIKKGFGPELYSHLANVLAVFGNKIRQKEAELIIKKYKETICLVCNLRVDCSQVRTRRAFVGEVYPEAEIKLNPGTDIANAPCMDNGIK